VFVSCPSFSGRPRESGASTWKGLPRIPFAWNVTESSCTRRLRSPNVAPPCLRRCQKCVRQVFPLPLYIGEWWARSAFEWTVDSPSVDFGPDVALLSSVFFLRLRNGSLPPAKLGFTPPSLEELATRHAFPPPFPLEGAGELRPIRAREDPLLCSVNGVRSPLLLLFNSFWISPGPAPPRTLDRG